MGWRFRKIFQSGPFRWTWTKKGVGWSIGVPGFRYGVSPNGSRYVSFGIPGTGLYFIKYLDKNKPAPQTQTQTPAQPSAQAPPMPNFISPSNSGNISFNRCAMVETEKHIDMEQDEKELTHLYRNVLNEIILHGKVAVWIDREESLKNIRP